MRAVVVGAGILGASTAYHLARDGAEVVVVDEAHAGRATAAGAGIVCPWPTAVEDAAFYALYAGAAAYYGPLVEELRERGEAGFGYRRVGALVVADDRAVLASVEERVRRRAEDRPEVGDVQRLEPAAARRRFPPLREGLDAVLVPGGARVEGAALTAALMRAAAAHGATSRTGHAALVLDGDRVTGVTAGGERIGADVVVVAAGAWAPAILATVGIDLGVEPQKGQIVHLRLPGVDTGAWPVLLPVADHYVVSFDDSRVAVGATRETGSGFDLAVTAGGVAEVLRAGLALAPGLAGATVLETRVGLRPMAADGRPRLGAAPTVAGLVVGNGLGAAGLTIGALAGRLLAQVAAGEEPDLDLRAFALGPGPDAGARPVQ